MILFDVVKRFDEACRVLIERRMVPMPDGIPNEDLIRLLKEHDRRNLCLNNVCEQISTFERSYKRVKQNGDKVNQLIACSAQLYVLAVLQHRREQIMSHAEQKRLASEGSLQKEMSAIVEDHTHVRRIPESGTPAA